jgi:hypothetical protein
MSEQHETGALDEQGCIDRARGLLAWAGHADTWCFRTSFLERLELTGRSPGC